MEPRLDSPSEADDLSSYLHRQCIGIVGALLPLLVWLFAGLRPDDGAAHPWRVLDSISAYYYSSGVVAFSGVLATLAVFLLTYRGYRNSHGRLDRMTAVVAGIAAIAVAAFPTAAVDGRAPDWWRGWIGVVHYTAATTLFACFMVFSLFLFTRNGTRAPSAGKRRRNAVYVACGVAIGLCMLWIAAFHRTHGIFAAESLALLCFATSWLVKGRVDHSARLFVRRARPRPAARDDAQDPASRTRRRAA